MTHSLNNCYISSITDTFLCQEKILCLFWLHKAGQSMHKERTFFIFIFHFSTRTSLTLSSTSTLFPCMCEQLASQKLLQTQSDTFFIVRLKYIKTLIQTYI